MTSEPWGLRLKGGKVKGDDEKRISIDHVCKTTLQNTF